LVSVFAGLEVLTTRGVDALENHADVASNVGELEIVGVSREHIGSRLPVVAVFGEGARIHPPGISRHNHSDVVGDQLDVPGSENICHGGRVGKVGSADGVELSAAETTEAGIFASVNCNTGKV
jgi:hypothetical protein